MRRIVFMFMSTVTAVVLLFGYRTSTPHPAGTTTTAVAAGGAGTSTGTGTSTTPTAPSATSTTVAGQAAQTRWGPVQVQITVNNGKVSAVDLLQVPASNHRDVEINDEAIPVLTQETLAAQSAQIDAVSGATVTSDGYITSLQSALDQAGL